MSRKCFCCSRDVQIADSFSHNADTSLSSQQPQHPTLCEVVQKYEIIAPTSCLDRGLGRLMCDSMGIAIADLDFRIAHILAEIYSARCSQDEKRGKWDDDGEDSLRVEIHYLEPSKHVDQHTLSRFAAKLQKAVKGHANLESSMCLECVNRSVLGHLPIVASVKKVVLSRNLIGSSGGSNALLGILAFQFVEKLTLSRNELKNFEQLEPLALLTHLDMLNIEGNPVSSLPFYRQNVLALCKASRRKVAAEKGSAREIEWYCRLRNLDNKPVEMREGIRAIDFIEKETAALRLIASANAAESKFRAERQLCQRKKEKSPDVLSPQQLVFRLIEGTSEIDFTRAIWFLRHRLNEEILSSLRKQREKSRGAASVEKLWRDWMKEVTIEATGEAESELLLLAHAMNAASTEPWSAAFTVLWNSWSEEACANKPQKPPHPIKLIHHGRVTPAALSIEKESEIDRKCTELKARRNLRLKKKCFALWSTLLPSSRSPSPLILQQQQHPSSNFIKQPVVVAATKRGKQEKEESPLPLNPAGLPTSHSSAPLQPSPSSTADDQQTSKEKYKEEKQEEAEELDEESEVRYFTLYKAFTKWFLRTQARVLRAKEQQFVVMRQQRKKQHRGARSSVERGEWARLKQQGKLRLVLSEWREKAAAKQGRMEEELERCAQQHFKRNLLSKWKRASILAEAEARYVSQRNRNLLERNQDSPMRQVAGSGAWQHISNTDRRQFLFKRWKKVAVAHNNNQQKREEEEENTIKESPPLPQCEGKPAAAAVPQNISEGYSTHVLAVSPPQPYLIPPVPQQQLQKADDNGTKHEEEEENNNNFSVDVSGIPRDADENENNHFAPHVPPSANNSVQTETEESSAVNLQSDQTQTDPSLPTKENHQIRQPRIEKQEEERRLLVVKKDKLSKYVVKIVGVLASSAVRRLKLKYFVTWEKFAREKCFNRKKFEATQKLAALHCDSARMTYMRFQEVEETAISRSRSKSPTLLQGTQQVQTEVLSLGNDSPHKDPLAATTKYSAEEEPGPQVPPEPSTAAAAFFPPPPPSARDIVKSVEANPSSYQPAEGALDPDNNFYQQHFHAREDGAYWLYGARQQISVGRPPSPSPAPAPAVIEHHHFFAHSASPVVFHHTRTILPEEDLSIAELLARARVAKQKLLRREANLRTYIEDSKSRGPSPMSLMGGPVSVSPFR